MESNQPENLKNSRKAIAFCFLVLLVRFASLAPGGPIETRDFSHLSPAVFNGFNAFLIILGLSGFVSTYFIWIAKNWAYWAGIMIGWSFIAVIALDLGKVFPRSPDPTGLILGLVMIVDAILAGYVVLLSHKALGHL